MRTDRPHGVAFWENEGLYEVARSSKKIPYGGIPIGNSGQDCRPRPVDPHYYYTTPGRICQ